MPCLSALLGILPILVFFLLGPDAVEPTELFFFLSEFSGFFGNMKNTFSTKKTFFSVEKIYDYLPCLSSDRKKSISESVTRADAAAIWDPTVV